MLQDPSGAFISVWESSRLPGVQVRNEKGSLDWSELQTRNVAAAKPFYEQVFGWGAKAGETAEGAPPYTEWQLDGHSVGGAIEGMSPMSFWLAYIQVEDVDGAAATARELGGQVIVEPQDFPGGRFAVITDPRAPRSASPGSH